jgi:hypothetical protein
MSDNGATIGSTHIAPASSQQPRPALKPLSIQAHGSLDLAPSASFGQRAYLGGASTPPEGSFIPLDVVLGVLHRDNHVCQVCHSHVPDAEAEFEQLIPLWAVGGVSVANLRLVCGACKRDRNSIQQTRTCN